MTSTPDGAERRVNARLRRQVPGLDGEFDLDIRLRLSTLARFGCTELEQRAARVVWVARRL